jgi:hypothetical protein
MFPLFSLVVQARRRGARVSTAQRDVNAEGMCLFSEAEGTTPFCRLSDGHFDCLQPVKVTSKQFAT